MSKKARALRRNMLIVCEGHVTEPEYFARLKKIALDNAIWDEIEIKPKPRSEDQEEGKVKQPSPHKSARPKRQLKKVQIPDEVDETEQLYSWQQTPVNFVKEARAGLKDDTFVEVWAVFDRNGHPAHPNAFSLADELVNGKKVNIAFSSIAFEFWMLLHFEKNITAFAKSECKQHQSYLCCGTGEHKDDCWGSRCVSGLMRVNQYMSCSTKKRDDAFYTFLSSLIIPERRNIAYENAAWLRHTVQYNGSEPYLTNPYTNVDELVKRMLDEDDHVIEWVSIGEPKKWNSLDVQIEKDDGALKFTIHNSGKITRLFNGNDIAIHSSKDGEKSEWLPDDAEHGVIQVETTKDYYTPVIEDFQAITFEIRVGKQRLLICS